MGRVRYNTVRKTCSNHRYTTPNGEAFGGFKFINEKYSNVEKNETTHRTIAWHLWAWPLRELEYFNQFVCEHCFHSLAGLKKWKPKGKLIARTFAFDWAPSFVVEVFFECALGSSPAAQGFNNARGKNCSSRTPAPKRDKKGTKIPLLTCE